MGAGVDPSAELWRSLTAEVERLTAGRPRGKNFSEDFAVDRVCTSIAKLRQQHERQQALAGDAALQQRGGAAAGGQEIMSLRLALAVEEQRLRIQQTKLDEARQQVKQAREIKVELEQELETEEAQRRQASEEQAKQWKEAAFRTHLCLNNLRMKERELLHLQNAISKPATLGEVWDGLVKKLQAELDVANVESMEARREHDGVAAECARAERELAAGPEPGAAASGPAPGPATTAASEALRQLRSAGLAPAGAVEPGAMRSELLRIASRADGGGHSEGLAQAASGGCGRSAGCGAGSRAPVPTVLQPQRMSPRAAPTNGSAPVGTGTGAAGGTNVRPSAHDLVHEMMDRLSTLRSPTSAAGAPQLFH